MWTKDPDPADPNIELIPLDPDPQRIVPETIAWIFRAISIVFLDATYLTGSEGWKLFSVE